MSLLTICQRLADKTKLTRKSTYYGSSDQTARTVVVNVSDACRWIARRHNWFSMVNEYTFSTVVDQEDYDFPSDYKNLVSETVWDSTNYNEVWGPLSPKDWQEYKSSVLGNSSAIWKKYRFRNVSGTNKFSIYPTPESVDSLVFEYMSDAWCQSSGGTRQSEWAADTDIGIIDEELIYLESLWRLREDIGLAYSEQKAEARNAIDTAVARDGTAPVLNLSNVSGVALVGEQNLPDSGYGGV